MNVKALLEDDFKIPVGVQVLILDGIRINDDSKSLKDYNVKQDDVIVVAAKDVGISPAERARNQINSDPNLRKQFVQVLDIK